MVTIEKCRVQRRGQQGGGALRQRLGRVIVTFVGRDEGLAAAGSSPAQSASWCAIERRAKIRSVPGAPSTLWPRHEARQVHLHERRLDYHR
ncbi:hypothetical protein DL768_000709 [Monosporascus sp. mg162]|nr:hypothetical protein DL768_000709 [Monosporascus sp. mg162]